MGKVIQRRQFVKTVATGTAAAYLAPMSVFGKSRVTNKSRVVRASHNSIIDSADKIDPVMARTTIDEAVVALTNTSSVKDAWAAIFPDLKSTDVIGIKINWRNNSGLGSHPEVVYAMTDSISGSLGLNPNNMIIWDRNDEEMANNGFTINRSDTGVRCFGTKVNRARRDGGGDDPRDVGYDMSTPVNVGGGTEVHFTKIMTQMCDYLINLPVLKDHRIVGVTLAMKNHYGTIDTPFRCHSNNGDPYVANISNTALIREKTKLILCDAVFGCYEGGPGAPPQFKQGEIWAAMDPVAHDSVGLTVVDKERLDRNLSSVVDMAVHIRTAAGLGVGTNNPDEIEVVNLQLG